MHKELITYCLVHILGVYLTQAINHIKEIIMAITAPKISLADLVEGIKGINGTKTTTSTSNSAFNQQALDQLMSTLMSSSSQYGKNNAIEDNTGITQRVTKAIQGAQPQLLSAQMGSGLRSSTTGALLQNDLVNQIMMSEGALQQQQIKDYATIQNQQAQAASNLAQVGNRTQVQQTPGIGLDGLIAPLALSYGGQYAYDKLFGGAEAGKQLASTVGGNAAGAMQGIPATNTGGTMLGNTLVSPSATVYPEPGIQVAERGAPVTDYSGIIANPSAAYKGSQAGMLANQTANTGAATYSSPEAASWFADDSANAANGVYSASASPAGFASMASDAGFDAAPGFGNVGGGIFAAADTLAHGGSIGQAGMEGGKAYLAMSNPYTAAAYIVDKMTGGVIGNGITNVSDFLGVKKPIDDAWQSGSDAISKGFKSIGLGTVICTAMYKQGLISRRAWKASSIYRVRYVSDAAYQYYLGWAAPIAASITANTTGKYSIKERLAMLLMRGYLALATDSRNPILRGIGKVFLAYNEYRAKHIKLIIYKETVQ
jgi:hypothetical protein